ncbi:hypothetical protein [Streptomyces sp. NPDC096339]|uniref:hypothetical protein n=1 Tax=Streptomyces sp. NPDC096339 TaxID=3366086 RepID=UPI00380B0973
MTRLSVVDAQVNRLWGALCACAGIFLFLWVLSWFKASILHEDLQNRCGDLHRASFPFEKSCTYEDGAVEGANSLLFEGVFFGSLAATVVCLGLVVTVEVGRRKAASRP